MYITSHSIIYKNFYYNPNSVEKRFFEKYHIYPDYLYIYLIENGFPSTVYQSINNQLDICYNELYYDYLNCENPFINRESAT